MARRITIEISVPDEAKWMTTDEDGEITLWHGVAPPEPAAIGGYWYAVNPTVRRKEHLTSMPEPTMEGRTIRTHIDCPSWRTSLVRLPEGSG